MGRQRSAVPLLPTSREWWIGVNGKGGGTVGRNRGRTRTVENGGDVRVGRRCFTRKTHTENSAVRNKFFCFKIDPVPFFILFRRHKTPRHFIPSRVFIHSFIYLPTCLPAYPPPYSFCVSSVCFLVGYRFRLW